MKKNRLESFSDGVFAIVITLLVLDLRLPSVSYAALGGSLRAMAPSIAAYVLSFLLVGMYWVFHHHAFTLLDAVDGVLLWLNIVFLLFISFLPFPTMMLGRYPFETLPVVFYGVNLLLANMMGLLSLVYLRFNPQLASARHTPELHRRQVQMYLSVNGLYIANIALAFVAPIVSVGVFGLMAVFLMVRSTALMGIGTCSQLDAVALAHRAPAPGIQA